MPAPHDAPSKGALDEGDAEGEASSSIDALIAAGDVDALLELARGYRSGTATLPKDLAQALACYRGAAELGSNEAEYAIALFYATGAAGLVERDYKELARRLRVAANRGHLASKVYLGNLYELGIHYTQDSTKADVWYRSAAREAGLDAEVDSPTWVVAMAKLGCVRQCLQLIADPSLTSEEHELYLRKAKAFGYQLHLRQRETLTPVPPSEAVSAAPGELERGTKKGQPKGTPQLASKEISKDTPKNISKETPKEEASKQGEVEDPEARARAFARARYTRIALAAFGYSLLFVAVGVGAGYLSMAGARELIAHRHAPLPVVGFHPESLMPAVAFVVGILPSLLVYRGGAWLRAIAVGGVCAVLGFALWAEPAAMLFPVRWAQALSFFVAGYLVTLLIAGLLGGAKVSSTRSSRARS